MPSSKKRKLPSHLHAVMGEANLRLARGDPTGAQKLCKEVIRQGVYVRIVMCCYQVWVVIFEGCMCLSLVGQPYVP